MPVHTHYDNLKVARNAPPEVIRAAYRTLSQKYHPDRNPGNTEAARIMSIINASYEVLSDPDKRRLHDLWIAEQEVLGTRGTTAATQTAHASSPPKSVTPPLSHRVGRVFAHVLRNWFWYGLAGFLLFLSVNDKPSAPPRGPKPYQATPTAPPPRPAYVRPESAPNGQPWPAVASYVKGYKRLHTRGLSSVTIDNSQNDSDVFVKLVSLDGPQAYPVRVFYIPAFGRFTLNKVSAGSYDVRYRDLSTGGLSRSEAFRLDETPESDGIRFARFTMTLYKVRDGNMKTYGLAESEF